MQDAPRLAYACPNDLRFEARLYQDMAFLEGQRGFARLPRTEDGAGGQEDETPVLRYRDATLLAEFGLGLDGRLAALHYTGIPETVYCRASAAGAVRAAPRRAPTPPAPPEPPAPVQTNVRTDDDPRNRPYN